MPNYSSIYGRATNLPPDKAIEEVARKDEAAQFINQKLAVHQQWINLQYTQDFLQKLRDEIFELDKEMKQLTLSYVAPDKYHLVKDKLQKKYLLEEVVRLATEGNNKLNDTSKTDTTKK